MTLKTDNHYVPRLYLKRWAGTHRKVWVYRVLVPNARVPLWRYSSIKGIGYHQNLYTRVLAGAEIDEFEDWLALKIETPAEEPIRKATADERLSSDDWECIIRFLAAQDVRTPARLVEFMTRQQAKLPALLEEVLQNVVQKLTEAQRTGKKIERPASGAGAGFPTRITKEIEPGAEIGTLKVETVVGRSLWLWSLPRLLTETYKVLRTHHWTIVAPPRGMAWVTSDNPVMKINAYADGRFDFKGGWGNPGTDIMMPLGPKHLLYTRIGERPPWIKGDRMPEPVALQIQRLIVEHAHRYIYAATPDPWIGEIRPRTVNAEWSSHEAEQWRRWGQEQSQAERDLGNPRPADSQPTSIGA